MKKGFTLIELLAVIVILAIIALIATPIVLNIINETKESATLRSAEFYMDAVENKIAMEMLKGETLDGPYNITEEGDLCKEAVIKNSECTSGVIKIEVSGEKPSSGSIKIGNGTIKDTLLNLNDKTIVNNAKGELVYQATLSTSCTLASDSPKAANEIGAKYSCDFGGGARDFYILEKGTNRVTGSTLKEDEVALILDGNYDETTQPWCASGNNNSCNADGLTAKLDAIAGVWTKLDRSQIVLPSVKQIVVADGLSEDAYEDYPKLTNSWLYIWTGNDDYNSGVGLSYGYWTSSAYSDDSDFAWLVGCNGDVGFVDVVNEDDIGVRPVINLKL